jgi:hypothetical protein
MDINMILLIAWGVGMFLLTSVLKTYAIKESLLTEKEILSASDIYRRSLMIRFASFLPIQSYDTSNEKLQKLIRQHKLLLRVFYIFSITGIIYFSIASFFIK